MHLIWFHRVLIGAAILFFGGFGVWELTRGAESGGNAVVLGLASLIVAAALAVYLYRLKRILKLPD